MPDVEAIEWRGPAPGNTGSKPQIFQLADHRLAIVKFPENDQGERVLVNEFICCRVAEHLQLPVNRAVRVSIDERIILDAKSKPNFPNNFTAGIRCGMIMFENPQSAGSPAEIRKSCSNHEELNDLVVFERLVNRQDSRQLLMYKPAGQAEQLFGAYDYGFALGGDGRWAVTALEAVAPVDLPTVDPFEGQPYPSDGAPLARIIDKLRLLTRETLRSIVMDLHPPC